MSASLDVKTLCLGVLSHGPASGYDIKKYFEQTFSHFYLAGYGSIYPALAELAAAGFVSCEAHSQTGRPDRKVYRLTDSGRHHFLDALAETEPNHKVRSEFLVLMHFAHLMPAERLATILDERIAGFDRDLAMLDGLTRGAAAPGCADAAPFCAGYGQVVLRAARDYIASQRDRLVAEARQRDAHRTADTPTAAAAPQRRHTGT